MSVQKKVSTEVKYDQGRVKGSAALDLNEDGKPLLKADITVDVKEAAGEIFQRQSGEGKQITLHSEVKDDLKIAFSAKLDTDKDGTPVAIFYGELDLLQLPAETIALLAKKKEALVQKELTKKEVQAASLSEITHSEEDEQSEAKSVESVEAVGTV